MTSYLPIHLEGTVGGLGVGSTSAPTIFDNASVWCKYTIYSFKIQEPINNNTNIIPVFVLTLNVYMDYYYPY